jgi:very-short-patch-repair endonuclease
MPKKPPLNPHLLGRARKLRKNSTGPEQLLWSILRNRGLGGLKFRRQHPLGPFVADFCCEAKQLIVEVDGESHEGNQQQDRERQQFLESQGYTVLRVTNDDVIQDLEAVAHAIAKAAGIPW